MSDEITIRQAFTSAIRFWERGRILYNVVLVGVVIAVYCTMQNPKPSNSFSNPLLLEFLFIMAVLANVAYCAAYIVDVFVQLSAMRDSWLRVRWVLFVIGLLFAVVLARQFAFDAFSRPLMPVPR